MEIAHVNAPIFSALVPELEFSTSRSSGPGGQNVNKVNSKVTVKLNIPKSSVLSDEQKGVLLAKLAGKITTEGVLVLSSQAKRSQLENKESVLMKLDALITKSFARKKARKKTKPSKTAKEKRIKTKKLVSEKKKWRQKF
jgi:ribosome-associated protein